MIFWWKYTINYDEERDDFHGLVESFSTNKSDPSVVAFEISDTTEMCDLIKTGVMSDIDDVKGLEVFLKKQDLIGKEDRVVIFRAALT